MDSLLLRALPSIRLPFTTSPLKSSPKLAPGKDATTGTLLRALKSANNLLLSLRDGLIDGERECERRIEERRQILSLRMKNAETLKQWEAAALELDDIEGNNLWKLNSSTGDYRPDLVEARLKQLDEARTDCDIRAMMYLIRTALSRDLGGMGNADLYRHSYVGTKKLIEHYVSSTVQTIDALVERSKHALPEAMEHKDLLEGLLCARQSFGRSALLLSGGGTFGMTHVGVLKALFEVNLLPRIISGASAGSIVCAVLCTRTDEEVPELLKTFPYGDLAVFGEKEKPDSFLEHVLRLLTEGSWSDIKHLTRVMQVLLGDMTFQEAYNRTRRILNICVSTASVYEMPRLLNYVTAPNVMIWSAVAASCSVPFVFTAAQLLVKNPVTGEHSPWNPTPQHWIDGSVDNDLPMTRLAEMFNVNHFIVSQVNPHVVPFLARDDQLYPTLGKKKPPSELARPEQLDWVYTFTAIAKDEALHRLQFLAELGIFPNLATKLRSILSQKYSGDINILPDVPLQNLPRLLKNPDSDFMKRCCLAGEQATWPKLSRIRDRLAIELALDRAVHQLRARVVFSASQVDLRRLATAITSNPVKDSMKSAGPVLPSFPGDERQGVGRASRRRSGSSIQLMTQHHRMLLDDGLTDDETEEEERLEMLSRCDQGTSPVTARKPRLRRSVKSHFEMPFVAGKLTSPIQRLGDEMTGYDFSKPLTPPVNRVIDAVVQPKAVEQVPAADESWKSDSIGRAVMVSPTEEVTSDMHSSDGYIEFQSDESISEPDPYDDRFWLGRRPSPAVNRPAKVVDGDGNRDPDPPLPRETETSL